MLFCFIAGTMALSVVVHRQWSSHEHIPYPIVTFTQAILPTADGRWSPVLRSRLFWISMGAQGILATAGSAAGWSRFGHIRPSGPHMLAFGIALVLTLGCAFARYRWAWWPLHPVFFLLLGTWQSKALAFSFLLGWLVKTLATRYGGHGTVQQIKPFMFGLVAGEVLACVLFMIHGACYYFIMHKPPLNYSVYPM